MDTLYTALNNASTGCLKNMDKGKLSTLQVNNTFPFTDENMKFCNNVLEGLSSFL